MWQRPVILLTAAALVGVLLTGLWKSPAAGQVASLAQFSALRQDPADQTGGPPSQTIAVSGQGEARARPDLALVSVGVETQAEQAEQAQQENAARMAAVVDAIKKLGVPETDIQTSALRLEPMREMEPRPQPQPSLGASQIVGYRAFNQVSVRLTDLALVGPVLDESVKAGANTEGGVRFSLKDDAALRQQALKNAVENARGKADAMAEALGVSISGVHAASEGFVASPAMMQDGVRAAPAAAPTPIEPGELTVSAQVQVVYSY